MTKIADRQRDYAAPRFGLWLSTHVIPKKQAASAGQTITQTRLSTMLAKKADLHETGSGAAIKRYLAGQSAPTRGKAFDIGQAIAENSAKAAPAGGLLALFAAGYFEESISLAYRLLVDMVIAPTHRQVSENHLPDPLAERAASDALALEYVLRFVGSAHIALADIDDCEIMDDRPDCDIPSITDDERKEALASLAAPPIAAIAEAWTQVYPSTLDREKADGKKKRYALELPVNIRMDPWQYKMGGYGAAALVAWAALVELIAQHVAGDDRYDALWTEQEDRWRSYVDRAHRAKGRPFKPILITRRPASKADAIAFEAREEKRKAEKSLSKEQR